MDSVSVTKSIRVSPEMAALMDNLIAAGEFSTTSELILEALAQFLEHHELGPSTRILRIKVHAEVERRLQALADAGDGPTVEDAAVKVLREHVKDRAKALVEDSAEFDRLAEKLQKRSLDAVAENARARGQQIALSLGMGCNRAGGSPPPPQRTVACAPRVESGMNQLVSKVAVRAWHGKTENTSADSGKSLGRRKMLVVGVGSAGCAAAEWVFEDAPQACTLAVNTDRLGLEIHKSETKMLLGARIFHGRGAQGHADAAERAAREAEAEIANQLAGYDIVVVLTALGGGTGTGAAHIIAHVAKGQGAAVVAVAVLPFKAERTRRERALAAFGLLKREAHTTILLDSEALLAVAGDLPMGRALGVMDYFMAEVPRSLARTLAVAELQETAVVEARALVLAGGVGTLCYAEWGAGGIETAVHHSLSAATGSAPIAGLVRIDSHDGLAPKGQENLLTGVSSRLQLPSSVAPSVRVMVQRDAALLEGGRAISIVTGLDDPCARREEAPPVTLHASRVRSSAKAPEVREAPAGAAQREVPDAPARLG